MNQQQIQQAVAALLPAAKKASELRAIGLRLCGDAAVIAELQKLAETSEDAAMVVGNLFPRGHAELMSKEKA